MILYSTLRFQLRALKTKLRRAAHNVPLRRYALVKMALWERETDLGSSNKGIMGYRTVLFRFKRIVFLDTRARAHAHTHTHTHTLTKRTHLCATRAKNRRFKKSITHRVNTRRSNHEPGEPAAPRNSFRAIN